MVTFTERLYKETIDDHKIVDNHKFVDMIKTDKDAGNMYINFNKICIYQIQKHILMSDTKLQQKLSIDFELCEMFITENLSTLLFRCSRFTVEHYYMFLLGLIMGGNMLKKYIDIKHHDFLTFDRPRELSKEFKDYLNKNIEEKDQTQFISDVKTSYKLIVKCFDEFYKKFDKKK